MAKIDFFIFGYRKITLDEGLVGVALSRLLRAGISAVRVGRGTIALRDRDFKRAAEILREIEFSASDTLGLYGKYKRIKYKWSIIAGALVAFALIFMLSNTVWDLRIECEGDLSASVVAEELNEAGFTVGTSWLGVDRSRVELEVLKGSENIGWINLNRRGTVAYIKVIAKSNSEPTPPEDYSPCDIVAACDAIVEEISVTRGKPLVKPGDAVKAGDVLILGVLPEDLGGGRCRAEGTVVGRMCGEISVKINRVHEESYFKSQKLLSLELKIFNFSANIFKNYGNLSSSCDIIEEIEPLYIPGGIKLPVEIKRITANEYSVVTESYSDDELTRVASYRLYSLTGIYLEGRDLVRIRTSGEFTADGYIMTNELTYTQPIGVARRD